MRLARSLLAPVARPLLHGVPFKPAASGRLIGTVISAKAQKTLKVHVDREYIHPIVHKRVTRTTKLLCHDEVGLAKVGDSVEVSPCRPISKLKHYIVVRVVRASSGQDDARQRKAESKLELVRAVERELAVTTRPAPSSSAEP